MKIIEKYVTAFLCGVVIASLLTLSLKFPLPVDSIDKTKPYCPNTTVEVVYVGLSGEIAKVKCANGVKAVINH